MTVLLLALGFLACFFAAVFLIGIAATHGCHSWTTTKGWLIWLIKVSAAMTFDLVGGCILMTTAFACMFFIIKELIH